MSCVAGKRILVVEDEFLIADAVACELVEAGAVVAGPYASWPEAMRAVEHGRIDAAVLDVGLQNGNVYPLARQLADRRVPILLYTGYPRDVLPDDLARAPHIAKPTCSGGILAAVQKLLQ